MPIFEFSCNKCGNKFEEIVKCNASGLICPACGSDAVQKLMSTFARGGSAGEGASHATSSGGCAGCSGGNCSSCCH